MVHGCGHDVDKWGHEKDFRTFRLFPVALLREKVLMILRVTASGALQIDLLHGPDAGPDGVFVCAMIFKGHMQSLIHI